jgi:hypothetical protein
MNMFNGFRFREHRGQYEAVRDSSHYRTLFSPPALFATFINTVAE